MMKLAIIDRDGVNMLSIKSLIFSEMLLPWNTQTEKATKSLLSGGYAEWKTEDKKENAHG